MPKPAHQKILIQEGVGRRRILAEAQEFTGRRRIFVVWVKRLSLGSHDWDPVACVNRKQATDEIAAARKVGDLAFVMPYQKAKRNRKDAAAETAADQNIPDL